MAAWLCRYTAAFLGMSNQAYCQWINNRANWGGGIELSILSKHYGREISAWNIESATSLVFGEEAGECWPRAFTWTSYT
jgi:hypothetical protein